jgi:hypothetical protein
MLKTYFTARGFQSTLFTLIFLLIFQFTTYGQDNAVAIGSADVKTDAVLWLNGNGSQGLLLPVADKDNFSPNNTSADGAGMMIYDASDNMVYFWTGTDWQSVSGSGGGVDTYALEINTNTIQLLKNGNAEGTAISLANIPLGTLSGDIGGTIESPQIQDGAVGLIQLDNMGLGSGDVGNILQWNGTAWEAVTNSGGTAIDQTLTLSSDQLTISGSGGNSVDLTNYLDNTDTQNLNLSGSTLNISNGTGVDLSPILSGGSTDDQNLVLTGDVLSIEGGTGSVDLSTYGDDGDADPTNENQDLSLSGNTLNISSGTGVDLSGYLDNSDAQDLSLSGATGTATTSEVFNLDVAGGTGVTVTEGTNIAIVRSGNNLTIGSTAAASGEANTASNVGAGGIGVFKQKTSADLELKNINAGSNKVIISDDTGNDEIDIDVDETNLTIASGQITGLGNLSAQDANSVAITGGTMTGVSIDNTVTGDGSGLTGITATVSTVAGKLSGDGAAGTPLTIATGAVTAAELADGAVTGGAGGIIADNSITGADISTTADITANSFLGDGSALTAVDAEQIRTTPIDPALAPALDEVLKWDGSKWTAQPDVAAGSPNTFAGAGSPGIVPDPVAETGNFLRDDGTWAVPAGAGDMIGANNLNELTNQATAQTNLGLGSIATLNSISSAEIAANTIVGSDISTGADIVANSFAGDGSGLTNISSTVHTVSTKISGDGSVGTPLTIATDAVTATELADAAVTGGAGGAISDNSITGADISTGADIVANSFSGDGSGLTGITSTVTVDGLTVNGDGSGTPLSIPIGGITTTQILDGTVSSTDIANSSIVNADIAASAAIDVSKIAGLVDNDAGNEVQNLSEVLAQGNSAGNAAITTLLDPTNPQDAATKSYVDTEVAGIAALPVLADGQILVGNTGAKATTLGGDALLIADGTLTITDGAISGGIGGKLADGSITTDDLQSPGGDMILTSDGGGNVAWDAKSSLSYLSSASNGLTVTGNDVALGGTMTSTTNIIGNSNDLNFNDLNEFTVAADITVFSTQAGVNVAEVSNETLLIGNGTNTARFQYRDGNESVGKVLTSGGTGIATWETSASSPWTLNAPDINYTAGNVGIGNSSPAALLDVLDGSVLFSGTSGTTPTSGSGTRLMWIPAKRALRAGSVIGTEWDDANIGTNSISFGANNISSGSNSSTIGQANTASATRSFAGGVSSIASGNGSTALGEGVLAGTRGGFAVGHYNTGGGSSSSFTTTDPVFEVGIGASSGSRANALTVLHGGNVGIGTSTPQEQLVVGDDIGSFYATYNATTIGGTSTGGALVVGQSLVSNMIMDHGTSGSRIITTDDLYINSSNVGIGTDGAINRLDVEGGAAIGTSYSGTSTARTNGLIVEGTTGFGIATPLTSSQVEIETINTYGLYIDQNATTGTTYGLVIAQGNSSGTEYGVYTTGEERNYFSANTGIGTTAPVNRLDVEGGLAVGTTYSGSSTAPTNGAIIQGNVGVGTNSPDTQMEIFSSSSNALRISGTGAAFASGALELNGTGTLDWRVKPALGILSFSRGDVEGGSMTDQYYMNDTFFSPATSGNKTLGASANRWSTVYATNGTINTSDRRLKKDIISLDYGLEEILEMKTVKFRWKNTQTDQKVHLGLIAQDVRKLIPEVIDIAADAQKSLGLSYTELVPVTIKAIQEQQAIISSQGIEIAALKSEIEALKSGKATSSNHPSSSELEKLKIEMAEIKAMLGMKAEIDD